MRTVWGMQHLACYYILTPWCRVILEKLTGLQLVKKFPAFHGTRWFFTALTSFRHLSLSSASPIQSIYPHPTYWRSVLILSIHLRLCLPSGLFPSGFLTKNLSLLLGIKICNFERKRIIDRTVLQTCEHASVKHFSCVNEIKAQENTLNKQLNIYNASPTSLA